MAAVLDCYVDEFITELRKWNANRTENDIEGALDSIVALIRSLLFEDTTAHKPFRRALATHENASLYLQFLNRVADAAASYIVDTTVRDFGRLHKVRIEHVYETFYILTLGIIGYMRSHPETDDEVFKDLITQTLHFEHEREESNTNHTVSRDRGDSPKSKS